MLQTSKINLKNHEATFEQRRMEEKLKKKTKNSCVSGCASMTGKETKGKNKLKWKNKKLLVCPKKEIREEEEAVEEVVST